MSFDLFGQQLNVTSELVISQPTGFVDRVGVHDANQYAKLNAGTIFFLEIERKFNI